MDAILARHLRGLLIPLLTQSFRGRLDHGIVERFQRDQHDVYFRVALDPNAEKCPVVNVQNQAISGSSGNLSGRRYNIRRLSNQ